MNYRQEPTFLVVWFVTIQVFNIYIIISLLSFLVIAIRLLVDGFGLINPQTGTQSKTSIQSQSKSNEMQNSMSNSFFGNFDTVQQIHQDTMSPSLMKVLLIYCCSNF